MARTPLTPVASPGGGACAIVEFTFAAGDASLGNSVVATGKELILCLNSGGSPYVLTISTVNGKIQYTVPAGSYTCTGTIPLAGFKQADNNIWIDVANAALKLAILKMP